MRAFVASLGLSLLSGSMVACSSTAGAYCQTAADCDEEIPFLNIPVDGVGDSSDSAQVCTVERQAYLDSLRANSEEVCQQLAAAEEAFMQCAIEQGDCDAWTDNDCDNEREDRDDLLREAENRCNE